MSFQAFVLSVLLLFPMKAVSNDHASNCTVVGQSIYLLRLMSGKVPLIEQKKGTTQVEKKNKQQHTINRSIEVMMCLNTAACRPFHCEAAHTRPCRTFIMEQWEVRDPGRKVHCTLPTTTQTFDVCCCACTHSPLCSRTTATRLRKLQIVAGDFND